LAGGWCSILSIKVVDIAALATADALAAATVVAATVASQSSSSHGKSRLLWSEGTIKMEDSGDNKEHISKQQHGDTHNGIEDS
jgi:hypothetical protein